MLSDRYFNPHAPCGARPESVVQRQPLSISILMPLAGHDRVDTFRRRPLEISILMPLAGHDGICGKTVDSASKFQSSCPLRGTTMLATVVKKMIEISILMPLAGHDRGGRRSDAHPADFNPHAPCGARLVFDHAPIHLF